MTKSLKIVCVGSSGAFGGSCVIYNTIPSTLRSNDQPEGDSAQEIPLILVVLNNTRYLSTGKRVGFSSLPGCHTGMLLWGCESDWMAAD